MTLAIQGNVEVLKKDDGSYLFPVTLTEAIKDSGTDKTLKQVMSEFEASVDSQLAQKVYETEIHGMRATEGKFEYFDGIKWITIQGGFPVGNVSSFEVKAGNEQATLKWIDPIDVILDGAILARWKGTRILRKTTGYPINENDGVLVVDSAIRDQYATVGFVDNGLINGVKYYYSAFPYTEENVYDQKADADGTPQPFKTMTAVIDLSNSNPATCITYADDAVGMTPGSAAWDEFFGHYPCLLKAGVEVGKLNKNNYTKFENGTAADITSGNAGDVMVAFPRRGVKITTVGTTMTIKMTDDPDNADFEYLAHTRGSTRKEKFYLGAYKGKTTSSKLRSLSGITPTTAQTIGTFRTQAQANGAGYEQSGFYQLVFRQVMYLLKYKNLNSQIAVGRGYVDGNSAAIATGGTNAKGMDFGETTGKLQMKLFGLEDFWGNVHEWIDGLFSNSTGRILTATDNFNNTGAGYTDRGQSATANISGYMSKPRGTSQTGFIIKEASGSETTYFADFASHMNASCLPYFGGYWNNAAMVGAFSLEVSTSASITNDYLGGRLMYL